MPFVVPKFIEREARIVGPLTFKQFIFIGVVIGICLFFYFTTSFPVFLLSVFLVGGLGFALAFLRIKGIPFPTILANLFKFTLSPKIFTWQKNGVSIIFKKLEMKEEKKDELPLKIAKDSQLKRLKLKVETKK